MNQRDIDVVREGGLIAFLERDSCGRPGEGVDVTVEEDGPAWDLALRGLVLRQSVEDGHLHRFGDVLS